MGMAFPLQYTNLVAYFTTDMPSLECPLRDMEGFFAILSLEPWRLQSGNPDSPWPERIRGIATVALEVVRQHMMSGNEHPEPPEDDWQEPLDRARQRVAEGRIAVGLDAPTASIGEVFESRRHILQDLHLAFRESHDLFVLTVANSWKDMEQVNAFLNERLAAREAPVSVLYLMPDAASGVSLDFLDPFPGASDICRYPERWPGVLIWNRFGNSLFLPQSTATRLLADRDFQRSFARPLSSGRLKRIERGYVPPPSSARQVRILHLSDLHFGTKYALKNQDYLIAVISDILENRFDRVVITGDLFDSPWKRKWRAFESFRNTLRAVTKNNPIVIPGNHDHRILGNALWRFGRSYRYIAELGAQPLHPDPALECLYFCFDSSKKGNFARGEVSDDDLVRLGTEYHLLARETPAVKHWLRIALVHHHPFKFDTVAEGTTARFLKAAHIPESTLVDMSNSERFVSWCADRGIQLILHGHRHVQRKMSQIVPVQQDGGTVGTVHVTAVGCGTSLGAEGIPATFNLVTWDSATQRWSTAFYLDRSGGGFKEVRAVSSTLDPLPREPG